MLVSPKDKPPLEQIPETVYDVSCEDCDSSYIGESARPLGKTLKEHNTRRASATSTVSEHLKSTQHHFDPEKVKILAMEPKDYSRNDT